MKTIMFISAFINHYREKYYVVMEGLRGGGIAVGNF